MTYQTRIRRVRNPDLPMGQRYTALRCAVEHYRRIGFHATWQFITSTDPHRPVPLDESGLFEALARLETSRNVWLAEMDSYAARRTALKHLGIQADREEVHYRHSQRWPGPDAHEAATVAVRYLRDRDREFHGPPEVWEPFTPLEQELSGLVDAFLGLGLDASQRRLLSTLHTQVTNARRRHTRHYDLSLATSRLSWAATLMRNDALPLVRRGWTGDAEAITAIFWAARGRMAYLPTLHTFEQTRWWVANIMAPQAELWVAEMRGVPVGFAALQGDSLDHLYLDPAHQGRGIGEALLAKAKRRRRELRLHVFEQNTGARAFYARHGFTVVGGGSDNEEGLPDLEMRWRR
ncbi:GNAT family N-acetyltransferase [Glycomyces sp. NPDC049804]|uniref:GNAT family N-acetyltransferase n=1 Tax=Glycomyces sp. NPDC049804 TaxID=3154363 RepID=UPI003424F4B4